MNDFQKLVQAFIQATGCDAVIWTRDGETGPLKAEAGRVSVPAPAVVELLPPGGAPAKVETDAGPLYVAAVAGPRRAWVGCGPCHDPHVDAVRLVEFLAVLVANLQRARLEVEHAAFELAERYEEINLLYTTSEIFGRTVSLEEAAARILEEIAETVGAGRGALLVHDRVTDTLQVVTAIGFDPKDAVPISVNDPRSETARVFREQHAMIVEPGPDVPAEEPYREGGSLLSVPILWTNPGHPAVPLGVVNLSGRRSGTAFSSGDEKLVSAIATQIGTAIQINRLVRSSLSQQRMQQEMQLANDLQMKLLPKTSHFLPEADIAARVVPAESVGGDFYHLFRLGDGRTGVMIGDVSSHGYRAALIMALVMSAASIHAQTTADPQEMLNAMLATISDELESTEMFVSAFYAVIDPFRRRMRYANAGHPHAFVVSVDGCVERLGAGAPPLGMSSAVPRTMERVWDPGAELLVLFTDGMSDARDRFDQRFGEEAVLDVVVAHRTATPRTIVDQVIMRLRQHMGDVLQRDDLTMVITRT